MFFPSSSVWKKVERRSQSHFREYGWLGPDPTWNTRGWYILMFPVVLITPTLYSPAQSFYLDLIWNHIICLLRGGYYNLYVYHRLLRATWGLSSQGLYQSYHLYMPCPYSSPSLHLGWWKFGSSIPCWVASLDQLSFRLAYFLLCYFDSSCQILSTLIGVVVMVFRVCCLSLLLMFGIKLNPLLCVNGQSIFLS